jgi:antitoxin component YwqK of YwqJK toxin-antitoxin module
LIHIIFVFIYSSLLYLLFSFNEPINDPEYSQDYRKDSTDLTSDHENTDSKSSDVFITGVDRKVNPKTGRITEIQYEDGVRNGPARVFFQNGQLWKDSQYKDNQLHGVSRLYDEKGLLKRETHYVDGKRQGVYREFFKSGNPRLHIEYYLNRPLLGFYEKDYTNKNKPQPVIEHSVKEYNQGIDRMLEIEFFLDPMPKGKVKYYFVPRGKSWKEIVQRSESDFYRNSIPMKDEAQNSALQVLKMERGQYITIEGEIVAVYNHSEELEVAISKNLRLTFDNF